MVLSFSKASPWLGSVVQRIISVNPENGFNSVRLFLFYTYRSYYPLNFDMVELPWVTSVK